MKTILSSGIIIQKILVDDDDFDYLNQWKWKIGKRGYAVRGVYDHVCNGKRLYKDVTLHRLVIRARPGEMVDHINGDKLDNQKSNLRLCNHAENMRNTKLSTRNTSGYKGIYWHKRSQYWQAYITYNQKHMYLGRYVDKMDAVKAYNAAAEKYFGVFAKTNSLLWSVAKS